jgi:hypothetical protein
MLKSIKSRARFLELFLFFCIPLIIGSFIYTWTYGMIKDFSATDGLSALLPPPTICTASLSMFERLLGMFVDGVSVFLLVWALFCFIRILQGFQRGEIFAQHTLYLFAKMSRVVFAWALYDFFESIPLSLATTISHPVGHRVLGVSITSSNVINIFIVGCFLVISSIIYEGVRLKNEQDLTI